MDFNLKDNWIIKFVLDPKISDLINKNKFQKVYSEMIQKYGSEYTYILTKLFLTAGIELLENLKCIPSNAFRNIVHEDDSFYIPHNIVRIAKGALFNIIEGRIAAIYYDGTEQEWDNIRKDEGWFYQENQQQKIPVICNDNTFYIDRNDGRKI